MAPSRPETSEAIQVRLPRARLLREQRASFLDLAKPLPAATVTSSLTRVSIPRPASQSTDTGSAGTRPGTRPASTRPEKRPGESSPRPESSDSSPDERVAGPSSSAVDRSTRPRSPSRPTPPDPPADAAPPTAAEPLPRHAPTSLDAAMTEVDGPEQPLALPVAGDQLVGDGDLQQALVDWFAPAADEPSAARAMEPGARRSRRTGATATDSVTIHIGKIELRSEPAPTAESPPPFKPRLSLSEYLHQRRTGAR